MAERLHTEPRDIDRELVVTRLVRAPRALVFRAFTEAAHVGAWWGPTGFTTTTAEMEVRAGGVWRFVMHAPDGTDLPNEVVFREVVAAERLDYTHGSGVPGSPTFDVTLLLTEEAGQTRVTLRALFPTAAALQGALDRGAAKGGQQSLEKLAEYLELMAGDDEFLLCRPLDAPRARVFAAVTDPALLGRWWPPAGATLEVSRLELRPGGVFHYGQRGPEGPPVWGKLVFRELVPPERLVGVASFSDAGGEVVRRPEAPEWPLEVLATAAFLDRGPRTVAAVRAAPLAPTDAERRAFAAGSEALRAGLEGAFDRLADLLARPA